ncbi:HEAT repeat domain-containing protein [Oscillatoria salina]|uniref:HEAT repeat domain-containing protein n=1 Tax=Oscillatoria salina TaxID=331517 RepID=UPI001CCE5CC3|nr:HEAT repeat domain-containing protein [Oscillatoria salina]MBZ8178551.1 HEAT repeat domain-containing protein [Oscillatoria salina IIICB1]
MVSQLTNALNRIFSWIEQHRSYYVKYLQPGLLKGKINNLIKDLPFQLPSEIYELYQWRNGALYQGKNLYDEGLIFKHSWSFRPLQEVVKIYLKNLNKQKYLENHLLYLYSPDWENYLKKIEILPIFYTIRYYDIDCYHSGNLWINQEKNLNPVIFNSFEEGENVLDKYSSVTSMMLTIAECYENGIYDRYTFGKYYESENKIWRKYNSELREFASEIIQEQSFSQLAWTYTIYELVEFKDLRNCQSLIQWLTDLINAYKKPDFRTNYLGIDLKLYRKNPDLFDYFKLETGLPKLLGELGDIRSVPILIAALQDNTFFQANPFSRVCAAKALGQLKDKRATLPLIYLLKDDWEESRKAAAWALGEIKDSRAAEPLIKALQDNNKEVRQAAREALSKLVLHSPELENIIPF